MDDRIGTIIHPSMRRQSPWLEFRGDTETDSNGGDSDAMLRAGSRLPAGAAGERISTCSPAADGLALGNHFFFLRVRLTAVTAILFAGEHRRLLQQTGLEFQSLVVKRKAASSFQIFLYSTRHIKFSNTCMEH